MLRISPGVRAFQASKLGFTMGFGEKSTFGDKFTEPLWVVVDLDYMVELAIPKSRDSVAEDPDARLVELEAKAKFYQAEYEYLCRKMPNAMFVVDPEQDCIVEANDAACRLLGYSRDHLLSSVTISDIHPHELEALGAAASASSIRMSRCCPTSMR
jgi:PAS domain-containing protein